MGCESISHFMLRTGTHMEVYEIWDMILDPVHVWNRNGFYVMEGYKTWVMNP